MRALVVLEPADSRPVSARQLYPRPFAFDAVEKYRTGLMIVSTALGHFRDPKFPPPTEIVHLSDASRYRGEYPSSFAVDSRGQPFIHRRDSIHQLLMLMPEAFEFVGEI